MKFWDDIVNKASLGSAKLALKASDIPDAIGHEFNITETDEPEEDFLRLSSFAYQFRQGGAQPLNLMAVVQPEAEIENKAYCSSNANDLLKTILAEELPRLTELWLTYCQSKNQLVHPEMIPVLLDIAQRKKELRRIILDVTGKRGEWLSGLNPSWAFVSAVQDPETTWSTGSPEERKELLRNLRAHRPDEALELLKTTWLTEGASEKAAFLEILKINLSAADLPWLEGLKEKGQKVNTAILELLKTIPSSSIVQEYGSILKATVNIRSGKALLGMINKTTLTIDESVDIPDTIFKTGIEKLSSNKNVTDSQYILVQLISSTPPSFWNEHLQLSTQAIIELFQKEKQSAFYLPAIAIAAVNFEDKNWIKSILDHGHEIVISSSIIPLIGALTGNERSTYAYKYMKDKPQEIIQLMMDVEEEWSMDLAKAILTYTAGEIYHYNRNFYRSTAAVIPVAILDSLNSFTPSEEQKKTYWKNQADELARLLTIKKQILQSFNL